MKQTNGQAICLLRDALSLFRIERVIELFSRIYLWSILFMNIDWLFYVVKQLSNLIEKWMMYNFSKSFFFYLSTLLFP